MITQPVAAALTSPPPVAPVANVQAPATSTASGAPPLATAAVHTKVALHRVADIIVLTRHGIAATASCERACRITATLVAAHAGSRLRVTLARRVSLLASGLSRTITLRPTAAVAPLLASLRRVSVTLRVDISEGNATHRYSETLVLKR